MSYPEETCPDLFVSHAAVPILKVDRLSYQYPTGQWALQDVSFSIAMNEVVGLVGPNGAGKTTLLQHLNGLLLGVRRPAPVHASVSTGGENAPPVDVLGMPVAPPNLAEIRRVVGLLFQDPDDQLFCPTVGEDVAFGPLNLGLPKEEVRRRVVESLEAVGLAGFESRVPQQLSFGERRRACLAGLLACEPNLLALDEPSSNLDPRSRRRLIELLRACQSAQLIASHDLELILELCDRVILLDQGRIHADGAPRDILSNSSLMLAHGLEVPLSLQYGLEVGPYREAGHLG